MMKNFTEDLICDNVNKLHINLVAILNFLFIYFFYEKTSKKKTNYDLV